MLHVSQVTCSSTQRSGAVAAICHAVQQLSAVACISKPTNSSHRAHHGSLAGFDDRMYQRVFKNTKAFSLEACAQLLAYYGPEVRPSVHKSTLHQVDVTISCLRYCTATYVHSKKRCTSTDCTTYSHCRQRRSCTLSRWLNMLQGIPCLKQQQP